MKLADLMRDRGLKDWELAQALDCKRSTVYQWRTGKFMPSAGYLKPLCELLQCSADDLLGIEIGTPAKINRALSRDLYKTITKNGEYNSSSIHLIASKMRAASGGKITNFECWLRDVAEVVYRIELTEKAKKAKQPPANQLRLI